MPDRQRLSDERIQKHQRVPEQIGNEQAFGFGKNHRKITTARFAEKEVGGEEKEGGNAAVVNRAHEAVERNKRRG